MVCKKNTGDLYWFGPGNALRPVGEESSVLSCTEVLVVGVTSECEKGRGSQVSRCEWSACVSDSAGAFARSRRVVCCCGGSSSSRVCVLSSFSLSCQERSLHAPFIASRRYRVTRCWYVVQS
jgi:hypothetical protein